MIYCVEDDDSIRELMVYTLNASGFAARGFSEANSFFKALENELPQLVLLDIMLPGKDGITVLKELRSGTETAKLPIIMASAKGTEYDKVIGLDLGADDYLAKPFGMMEMVSRVKAVLRRTEKQKNEILTFGDLKIDTSAHTVSVNGERIELTLKEYELLRLLAANPGKAFSRDSLLTLIWDSDYAGETRTVDVHIGTLRSKLGNCGEYIKTVRGVGYRMEV